jgi:hypothetical protein
VSNTVIGAILLVVFIALYLLKKMPTIRALAAFVGTILVFEAGWIGRALGAVARWLANLSGTATGWAFGAAFIGIPAIIAGIFFIHDIWPKHAASNRTGWAGIIFAALIMAGATGIPALNHVGPAVQQGVTNARQIGG